MREPPRTSTLRKPRWSRNSTTESANYDSSLGDGAPPEFRSAPLDDRGLPGTRFTLQVYAEDCTGCALCVEACPVSAPGEPDRKAINLAEREPIVAAERPRDSCL